MRRKCNGKERSDERKKSEGKGKEKNGSGERYVMAEENEKVAWKKCRERKGRKRRESGTERDAIKRENRFEKDGEKKSEVREV